MEMKIYRCAHCGNVAYKIVDSGVQMVCCGEQMKLLKAGDVDASQEKHVPVITREGDKVKIQVGSALHPMLPEHYIQFIAAIDEDTTTIRRLAPGMQPTMELTTDKDVKAYELCNLHGLWTSR